MKTIVLTGMMGAGKSTIAQILAHKYNCSVLDIDSIIVEKENMSIADIFISKNEDYFRNVEYHTILKYVKFEDQIVSLGGGALENKKTREYLIENTFVVYLKTSPEVIYERIKNDTSRPLLCGNMTVKKIRELIDAREKNYECAHRTILTDNMTPNEIVQELYND